MPVDIVRDSAIDTLLRVFNKKIQLSAALDRTIRRKGDRLSSRGRRFLTQLVYGTTRHIYLAEYVLRIVEGRFVPIDGSSGAEYRALLDQMELPPQ